MLWLLHGNLGRPSDWKMIQQKLETENIPSQALDLWEFLPTSDTPHALAESGKLLSAYIQRKDDHPILCGYSLGGRLALHAWKANPTLWKSLILISTHWGLPSDAQAERQDRIQRDAEWASQLEEKSWTHFYEEWTNQPVFKGDKNTLRNEPSETEKQAYIRAFRLWSLGHQQDQTLDIPPRDIPLPIQLIQGESDSKFISHAHHIKHTLHHTSYPITLNTIPNAGHRLLETTPMHLCALIREHF